MAANSSSVASMCDWPAARRLICYDDKEWLAGGLKELKICSLAGPVTISHKEPAGLTFQTKVLQQQGLYVYPDSERPSTPPKPEGKSLPSPSSSASLDADQPPPGVSWKGSKKKKDKKKKEKLDLYALLGLANERFMATEKNLKDAYRRVCLEHHPDKRLANVTDEAEKNRVETYFKQIQEAYGILSDPAKRREYDSTDEFDDSLPLDCASVDFFKVFGPAFRRNSRWSSSNKAVPDLGDETATWQEVENFYNFWFTFKSWREFPHPDEEDVEGAESREHRRWIERINSKLREKGKKEEGRRLRDFVEAAYKLDPRVVAHKEEERAERDRKKQEKEDARRKIEEEAAAAKAAEEAAKKAIEDAAKKVREEAKAAKEALKRAMKKERQRLRAVCDGGEDFPRLASEDEVDKLCTSLPLEKMQALCESLFAFGISRDQQQEIIIAALTELLGAAAMEAAAKERQKREAEEALRNQAKREHAKKLEAMREWNDEELRMLDKAVAKFPQGTPKRWDAVAAYVRTRSLEEVLLMVKERQGMSASRMKAQEDFRAGIKKRAETTNVADLRVHAFTDVNVNLAGAAASQVLTDLNIAEAEAATASSASTATATPQSTSAAGSSTATSAPPPAQPAAPAKAAAAEKAAPAATAAPGDWNQEQELALVKALKQFGKELGQERWDRVSEVVPGKSKAQCFKRFKEMREAFRAKKGGAGGDDGDE